MAEPEPLQILVDTDVRVASEETPRRIVDALRRHLRQHDLGTSGESPAVLSLLQTREGQHLMPQGLLPKVTETCRRHGVPYAVVDRRAMVACPPFRSRLALDEGEQEALRRLLLRDSGVVVTSEARSRLALAAELVARRQQRTLVAVESPRQAETWLAELRSSLALGAAYVQPLKGATADARVVVGRYDAIARLPHPVLRRDYGLVIFDGVSQVDALTLMKVIRAAGARYLLGFADSAQRSDGLGSPIILALGGVIQQLTRPTATPTPRLTCCFRATDFDFAYGGRQQYQALVAALAADEARGRLVVEDVVREARAGQPCLVLSERRDHLEQLARLLPSDLAAETLTSAVHPAERTRIVARFEEGDIAVLLATGQITTEAVCSARARRLFLTFPFSYARKLESTIRKLLEPSPGKEDAIVYDYDDPRVAPLHRAFEKRRAFLTRLAREADQAAASEAQLHLPV